MVAKFDRDGTRLWRRILPILGVAFSVAVDNQGNVVAAGFNFGVASTDFTVAKFDGDGTLLWQQNLNGATNRDDLARSVAVDNEGNVVATGYTINTGTIPDFTVAKFDRDGTLLWEQILTGTGISVFEPLPVAVDNQGNVVAGRLGRVAKFDRDGILLWQQNVSSNSVAVDNQGSVVTRSGFRVAKVDRDGALLWQSNLNATATDGGSAKSMAVDNQGNVVAAGYTVNTGTGNDFAVAKFDRDGTLLWQQTLTGTAANSDDEALSVAVDHQGNVVAAGHTQNTGTGIDFTVAKFDRDGTLLWQQTLNGTANFGDALSVAVDNRGNVVAAGSTANTGTGTDFTVAKFAR
jgi:uncharacterized delta-60 repeat protein